MELLVPNGSFVLPGEIVVKFSSSTELHLGVGLRYIPVTKDACPVLICTKPGELVVRSTVFPGTKKSTPIARIATHASIYTAKEGDLVVGVILKEIPGSYLVDINATQPAFLSHVAFDGATRQNRPKLYTDDLVYARIIHAIRDVEPEITCCAPDGGRRKDWVTGEGDFGSLKGGFYITVSPNYACRLMEEGNVTLRALSKVLHFEVAIGSNGRVWVNAGTVREILALTHILETTENIKKSRLEKQIRRSLSSLRA